MKQKVSVRVKDTRGQTWIVTPGRRSCYNIKKKSSKRVSESGWTALGTITRYCEPRGNGLRWEDLGGKESRKVYPSLKACLLAFIAEMEARRKENRDE